MMMKVVRHQKAKVLKVKKKIIIIYTKQTYIKKNIIIKAIKDIIVMMIKMMMMT